MSDWIPAGSAPGGAVDPDSRTVPGERVHNRFRGPQWRTAQPRPGV